MIKLPDYFLRKVSGYPGGIRLTKLERVYESMQTKYSGFHGVGLLQKGEPLTGGDYRYWCGTKYVTNMNTGLGKCRNCGHITFTREERKIHKNNGCGSALEKAYKQLKRETTCVICGGYTNKKVYGLAMCCNECVEEWEFETVCPTTLGEVLDLNKKET